MKNENRKNNPKTRPTIAGHGEQPEDKDSNLITPKKKMELSRSGGGMNVNRPRPRRELRLRCVGPPEETYWRGELAGTKSLVLLPSKSCSAPREDEV